MLSQKFELNVEEEVTLLDKYQERIVVTRHGKFADHIKSI